MKKTTRIFFAILIFLSTYYFASFIPGALFAKKYFWMSYIVAFVLSSTTVWLYWLKSSSDQKNQSVGNMMLRIGLGVGAICFLGGFIGPMILIPESNLGPILGFLTGPLGFILGLIIGGIAGIVKNTKS